MQWRTKKRSEGQMAPKELGGRPPRNPYMYPGTNFILRSRISSDVHELLSSTEFSLMNNPDGHLDRSHCVHLWDLIARITECDSGAFRIRIGRE